MHDPIAEAVEQAAARPRPVVWRVPKNATAKMVFGEVDYLNITHWTVD